jgi:hypothetical protein
MAKLTVMKSMELDDEDKLDAVMPIPMPTKPDFPYGLQICLTEAEFAKLDIDPSEAEVGGIFHGHFLARITSVSENDSPNGKCVRVEAQIEDLAIESEDLENEDAD